MVIYVKMRPRHLIFALLFLLTIGIARADLSLTVTPVHPDIAWDGTAIFSVTVTNNGTTDVVRLKPATSEWGTIRFDDYVLTVAGSATTRAYVQPPRDVLIGTYALEIQALLNSNPNIRAADFLKLTVTSELAHVEPNWNIPQVMNPGPANVTLILKNTGTFAVDGMTAKLDSSFLKAPVDISVGEMAKNEARVAWTSTLDIPLNTPSKTYSFTLSTFRNNVFVNSYPYPIHILEKESVRADVVTTQKFLGTKYTVALTNVGNIPANNSYKITVPSWQRFFIEGKVKPKTSVDGKIAEAAWAYSLPLGASMTLIYTISFMPLLAILIAVLLLLYVGLWYLTQGLSIAKELVHAERALKVKLHIKNNSTKPQRNIIVEDSIPTPLTLVREFATLHPTAIKKGEGSVKLLWKFDVIWPHEEKILTYNLKSALGVVGTVLLPAAKIRKKGDPGETPKVFVSNRVAVRGNIRAAERIGED